MWWPPLICASFVNRFVSVRWRFYWWRRLVEEPAPEFRYQHRVLEREGCRAKKPIDDLLPKGVEGIVLSTIDPGNQTQLISGTAKRVLVITQDSDAPKK